MVCVLLATTTVVLLHVATARESEGRDHGDFVCHDDKPALCYYTWPCTPPRKCDCLCENPPC